MDAPQRVVELLEEIRDIQKAWAEESRARLDRSLQVQSEAVKRQTAAIRLYKAALVVGLCIILGLVYFLWTNAPST